MHAGFIFGIFYMRACFMLAWTKNAGSMHAWKTRVALTDGDAPNKKGG